MSEGVGCEGEVSAGEGYCAVLDGVFAGEEDISGVVSGYINFKSGGAGYVVCEFYCSVILSVKGEGI